jgi:kynurenine formamidase
VCDSRTTPAAQGWLGWPDLPSARAGEAAGEWTDLTWPFSPEVPRLASFPRPRIERIMAMPEQPFNVSELHTVVHMGTHVDAPRHFVLDGPALDEIPLDRLVGRGVVWRIEKPPLGLVDVPDLAAMQPRLEPGDILALDTGAQARAGTKAYDEHPSLSVEAARWLVEQRVKLVAVDVATPELALAARPAGFDWPIHRLLLGSGVLIAEQVTNLGTLAGRRAEFAFCPIPIVGSDGAPARVLARPIAG